MNTIFKNVLNISLSLIIIFWTSILIGQNCGEADFSYTIAGKYVLFTGKSSLSDNANYSWTFGNGKVEDGREVKAEYNTTGIYEVCLKVKNANCTVSKCKPILFFNSIQDSTCNLGADFDYTADTNGVVKVIGKTTSKDSVRYFWIFNNQRIADGKEAKIQFEKSGEYQVCLFLLKATATNTTLPCYQSICKTVKVNVNTPPCNLKVETEFKLDGLTGIFQAKSNLDNTKYLWYVAGANKQYEGREVKIPFEKSGVYEVCVQAFTTANCKVQVCKRVEIVTVCNLGADFTYSVDSNGIIKVLGKSIAGDTAKYYWTFGNGLSAEGKEAKAQYEKNGEYQVCLKVLKPFPSSSTQPCIQSICKTVKVNVNTPPCNLKVETEFKLDGLTGIFQAKSNLDNTKYLWYVAGANKQYEGREVKIPFEKSGVYEVCVQAFTTANCKIQVCKRVEIGTVCNLGADFTYSVDSNGIIKVLGKSIAGDTAKYYWTFGNGLSAEGKEAKAQYEKNGEYQVCLKVLKPSPSSSTQPYIQSICKTVKVNVNTPPCNLKVETEFKLDGLTGIFQAKSNLDNTKYLWYVAGANKQYEGREVKIPFEKSGVYEVCVQAFTTANCKVQVCKRVEIGTVCNLGADFTYSVDSNGIIKVLGKSIAGDTAKYYWTFGNGLSAEGKEAKAQYAKSGEYQVCLKVLKPSASSNVQACTQSVCKTVKVNVNTPPCNLKVETEFKLDGLTGIFQAKSNLDNTKYVWYIANKKFEGREIKIPFEKAGVYEVCVVGYTATCEVKVCKRVEINGAITCNLGADFTFETDNDVLKAKATSTSGIAVKYYWTFGNGIAVEGKDATFKFDKPGDYSLCLRVTRVSASNIADSSACTQVVCKKVSIKSQAAECRLTPDFTYKSEGKTVTFSGKSSDSNAKYYWYAKDVKMELTGKDVRFQFEKAASYEVCMIVVNGTETCKDQICKKISVGNRISVFPNPTVDVLNIAVDDDISRITIYDQFNRVVHSGILTDSYGNIDISQLNSGMYSISVQLVNGEILARKFYKQ